ncbi:hypothetical protein EYY94_01500, partial [Obesumbacterium proteus]|uniref:RHS repeat-associated core domain-containing protein n=1 Tax=Obesumbacterium proteus TaxID=82983 RepID=UPI001033D3A3
HTVYLPHSFVPLLRFEGDKPPTVTPLADKLEQEVGITLPPDFKHTLHHIEQALRANRLSTEQRAWLNQIQLSPDYLETLLDPLPDTPYAAQLYDCNHLGTPQQLINLNGHIDWSITLDAWGNTLSEENPHQLHQPIRMQGQQYDEESGLHYNRHRYYDTTIGRYITQDPIGLDGGWNGYIYPLNPIINIDPLGLETLKCIKPLHSIGGEGEKSGPDIWGNPLYHQYLCVPDGKNGYICGGQDQRGKRSSDGIFGPGKASQDSKNSAGRCDTLEPDNSCLENCLKEKFKGPRPLYTVLPDWLFPVKLGLTKNCQDWSDDTFETCKNKCNGNNFKKLINYLYKGIL